MPVTTFFGIELPQLRMVAKRRFPDHAPPIEKAQGKYVWRRADWLLRAERAQRGSGEQAYQQRPQPG